MKAYKFYIALFLAGAVLSGCKKSNPITPIGEDEGYVVYGNIYTAESDQPSATAFAVRAGKFEYIGTIDGVKDYIGPKTLVYDFKDKGMVMPGMCDSHSHYFIDASFEVLHRNGKAVRFDVNANYEQYLNGLSAFLKAHPDAKQIFGMGYSTPKLGAVRTASDLDKISDDIPIFTMGFDLHDCCVNTFLLKKAGVIDENGKPTGKYDGFCGGTVTVDDNGIPTGVLTEQLASYVLINYLGLEFTEADNLEIISRAQSKLHSMGVVSALEGWSNFYGNDSFYKGAAQKDAKGEFKLNYTLCYSIPTWHKNDYLEETKLAVSLKDKYTGKHLRHNVKLFIDGLVETGKGYILGEYPESFGLKDRHGIPNWKEKEVADIVELANSKGEGVHCHVMGDAAARSAIDAFTQSPYHDEVRNSMCHLRNVAPEDFAKIAACNAGCAAGTNWHAMDDEARSLTKEILNNPYGTQAYPLKSFINAGVHMSHSSDCPCDGGSYLPFESMEIAVTGLDYKIGTQTGPWWREELMSIDQALQALTINGAWMLGLDQERGSISKGKYADFVVVDQNLLTCSPEKIHSTNVVATFFEGELVYGTVPNVLLQLTGR